VGSKCRHSRVSSLIAAALAAFCAAGVGLAAPVGPAFADPGGDAKDAGRRADRAEAILEGATLTARTAARRLESATAALPAAQLKIATTRGLVTAAGAAANTARRKANTARAEYEDVAGRFAQAQTRVLEARQRVDTIAAASYMGGNFAALNVLVGATGPQDAMDRFGLVDQVMHKQQDGVAEMTAARWAARSLQDQSGLTKRVAEDAERDAADKLAAAQNAQNAAVRARAAVVMLADTRRRALAVARSQRSAVLAMYRRARDEETRIQSALRAWQSKDGTAGTMTVVGGKLLMPVHGWKSSDFGERYDPYYRVWQLHAGADFAADSGSPIRAAADGRVIRAGWNGGYGNYTCVGHGMFDGKFFSSCYGHQAEILVRVGERVHRGEVIGRVGITGASTGYHLHFETRFNGVPKNPLPYLPSCLC
jgi:murein DD-endopeptidase MepM/ murein hydrolase activator NlpD